MDRTEPGPEAVEILLVDDEPGDIRLTQRVLRQGGVPSRLHVAKNGEEALEFLRRGARDAHAPSADLVLLDLNLPTISGFEVLEGVRADPSLTATPVIVLTTSNAESDVLRAYEGHANAYMTKPVEFDRFVESIQALTDYWFSRCRLPNPVATRRGRSDENTDLSEG